MPRESLFKKRRGCDAAFCVILVQGDRCQRGPLQEVQRMCAPRRGAGPADRQFLFTVFVHPHPDFPGFDAGSPFYGHELTDRVQVGVSRLTLPAQTEKELLLVGP